eukprot:215967-Pleurochrysis_carterae.AAC.1
MCLCRIVGFAGSADAEAGAGGGRSRLDSRRAGGDCQEPQRQRQLDVDRPLAATSRALPRPSYLGI